MPSPARILHLKLLINTFTVSSPSSYTRPLYPKIYNSIVVALILSYGDILIHLKYFINLLKS